MSQTVTLELPHKLYEAVEHAANETGQTPAGWIMAGLHRLLPERDDDQIRRQIPDSIYEILEEIAPKEGMRTEELAAYWVKHYGPQPRPQLTEEEWEAARQRLRRHAGAVSSGDPQSADNERIDADLAREYGNTHEEV